MDAHSCIAPGNWSRSENIPSTQARFQCCCASPLLRGAFADDSAALSQPSQSRTGNSGNGCLGSAAARCAAVLYGETSMMDEWTAPRRPLQRKRERTCTTPSPGPLYMARSCGGMVRNNLFFLLEQVDEHLVAAVRRTVAVPQLRPVPREHRFVAVEPGVRERELVAEARLLRVVLELEPHDPEGLEHAARVADVERDVDGELELGRDEVVEEPERVRVAGCVRGVDERLLVGEAAVPEHDGADWLVPLPCGALAAACGSAMSGTLPHQLDSAHTQHRSTLQGGSLSISEEVGAGVRLNAERRPGQQWRGDSRRRTAHRACCSSDRTRWMPSFARRAVADEADRPIGRSATSLAARATLVDLEHARGRATLSTPTSPAVRTTFHSPCTHRSTSTCPPPAAIRGTLSLPMAPSSAEARRRGQQECVSSTSVNDCWPAAQGWTRGTRELMSGRDAVRPMTRRAPGRIQAAQCPL